MSLSYSENSSTSVLGLFNSTGDLDKYSTKLTLFSISCTGLGEFWELTISTSVYNEANSL